MGPEFWVGLAAVFVSGGAVGSAGTLLARWILDKVDGAPGKARESAADLERLRAEVAELGHHLRNLDARLDFTEQLLDGALSLAPPPSRSPETEREADDRAEAERRDA
jgi:hypothetical protein